MVPKHRADTYRDKRKRRKTCAHYNYETHETYIFKARGGSFCLNCAKIWMNN